MLKNHIEVHNQVHGKSKLSEKVIVIFVQQMHSMY